AIRKAGQTAAGELVRIEQRRIAEIDALQLDEVAKQAERARNRATLEREVAGQLVEIEASAAEERATCEGRMFEQVSVFFGALRSGASNSRLRKCESLSRRTSAGVRSPNRTSSC